MTTPAAALPTATATALPTTTPLATLCLLLRRWRTARSRNCSSRVRSRNAAAWGGCVERLVLLRILLLLSLDLLAPLPRLVSPSTASRRLRPWRLLFSAAAAPVVVVVVVATTTAASLAASAWPRGG
ncbi:hypothetical protein BC567DRAFT_227238 [Phyllosticta citribraziliensis]